MHANRTSAAARDLLCGICALAWLALYAACATPAPPAPTTDAATADSRPTKEAAEPVLSEPAAPADDAATTVSADAAKHGAATGSTIQKPASSEDSPQGNGPASGSANDAGGPAVSALRFVPPAEKAQGSQDLAGRQSPPGASSQTNPSQGGGGSSAPQPPLTPIEPVLVQMISSTVEAPVGARISVRVYLTDGADVASVPFHVLYNPGVLRFEGGTEGTLLRGGAKETAFFAAPMGGGREMVVGLSRLGQGPGASGTGELCTLDFTAVGPGDAGLAFTRAHVRDSTGRIVPATFVPAHVTAR